MDDVESVEFDEESLDEYDLPAVVSVDIVFKSGLREKVSFNTPKWTPVYAEPITGLSIHQIVASAFSVGDVPFLALPLENGVRYFDLSSVDYVDVEVRYTGESTGT